MAKYYGGCDAGSTYTKCVILDETGKIAANITKRSRINPVLSAKDSLDEAVALVDGLNSADELDYLIGTGYGRNKVPFADENISEISCHAMGVHVAAPDVKAIIDIGGQDVKGIAIDTDGTVLNFSMNDKCAAGTGRFFESMARAFEMSLDEFSKLSLTAKNVIPITAQCAVFAESEVISLVGEGKPMEEIAAGSFQLCTKEEYYDNLIRICSQPRRYTLTDAALETLSIIAYKQPVTKIEIEKIRGVNSDRSVNKLVELELVKEVGRLDAPGRPMLFGTTEEFLRTFGVGSIDELPVISEDMVEQYKEEAEYEIASELKEEAMNEEQLTLDI